MTKSRAAHESHDASERLVQKLSRSSDEGRSSRRNSRSHPPSNSSLFAQQNVTLENIPASKRLSRPGSPTLSTSRTVSTARPATATTHPSSKFPVRPVAQRAASQQPKVEDDQERVPQYPEPVEQPLQIPTDVVEPHADVSTPTIATAPVRWSTWQLAPPKSERASIVYGSDDHSKVPNSSAAPSTSKASLDAVRLQARKPFDESQLRHAHHHQNNPATPTKPSAISPPHSPRLYGQNPPNYVPVYMTAPPPFDSARSSPASPPPQGMPPQGMPPMNYGYVPMATAGPSPSVYGNSYYGMPFAPPAEQIVPKGEGSGSLSTTADGHQQLLEKIAGVLPDINRLLNNYQGSNGQLPAKQLLEQQADLSHNEQLSRVKLELDATKKEYEKVIQRLVDDRGKIQRELVDTRQRAIGLEKGQTESKALRTEVESLQASRKEMTEGLDGMRRSKEEMQTLKLAHEKEINFLKTSLQTEKDLYHRNVTETKEQARDQMDQKQKELRKTISDQKLSYSKIQAELASLLSRHHNQKKELDAARSSDADHKTKLNLKCKEIETTLVKHSQDIQSIKKKHEEEREKMAREESERSGAIAQQHAAREKQWEQDLRNIGAELELAKTESRRLRDEIGKVEKKKEAENMQKFAELVESLAVWRAKSDDLHRERQNLDRILQGLGYSIETRGKGLERP